MLVTPSFVMLNNPKTGSSFCRSVVKEIHERRRAGSGRLRRLRGRDNSLEELLLPNIKIVQGGPRDQHGTWSQIPEQYRDREVVSVVRNPFDRFLSMYEFRWWEQHPPVPMDVVRERLPQFPDLSLDDFVELNRLAVSHGRMPGGGGDVVLGNQSAQFVQMFFRDPAAVLAGMSQAYVDSDRPQQDLAPVTFLRQEQLNLDLAGFLERHGYTPDEVEHAGKRERVNVTATDQAKRMALWTDGALGYIRQHEQLLTRTLAAVGIGYDEPTGALEEPERP